MFQILYGVAFVLVTTFIWLISFGRSKSFFWQSIVEKYGYSQTENLKILFGTIVTTIVGVPLTIAAMHYFALGVISMIIVQTLSSILLTVIFANMIAEENDDARCIWFIVPLMLNMGIVMDMKHSSPVSSIKLPAIEQNEVLTFGSTESLLSGHISTGLNFVGIATPTDKCKNIDKTLASNDVLKADVYHVDANSPTTIIVSKTYDENDFQGYIPVFHQSSNPFDDGANSYKCYIKVSFNSENLREMINNGQHMSISHIDEADLNKIIQQ